MSKRSAGYGWRHPLWRYRLAVGLCGRRPGHGSDASGKPPEAWGMIAPGGGQELGGVPRGLPGGAEQREGLGGQGAVPVFGACTTMDLDLEALPIAVRDLEAESFLEPEAQALDGGEVRLVVEGGADVRSRLTSSIRRTAERRWVVGARRSKGVPGAREDALGEEAHATVAETHGRGGEAGDSFSVQAGVLEFWF